MTAPAELGLVLLSMAAGSVIALVMAGWLIARCGSRVVISSAALGFCVALPLPVLHRLTPRPEMN